MTHAIINLEKENNMTFNWRYAINKTLIMLTSGKTLSIIASASLAVFGFDLPVEIQAYIISGAGILISAFKLLDSVLDKTAPPV